MIELIINEKQQALYEMANYQKSDSDLPANIWFDSAGVSRNTPHKKFRVKVQCNHSDGFTALSDLVPVEVSTNGCRRLIDKKGELSSKEWSKIYKFLEYNFDIILKHYNQEISDKVLLNSLVNLS